MRNYIAFFGGSIKKQDVVLNISNLSAFADTAEECTALLNGLLVPGDTELNRTGPLPAWFCLDKGNIIGFLNYVANAGYPGIGAALFDNLLGGPNSTFIANDGANETPRDGWTDGSGVKREPTPSDKQTAAKGTKFVPAEVLLDSLRTFAAALIAAGFKNTGPRSLLAQLTVFIGKVAANQPFDQSALAVLLQKIESALIS